MAKQGTFDNVLDGFFEQKKLLEVKRAKQRWALRESAVIDIQGKLVDCDVVDASAHVVRINMPMPLNLRDKCILVFRNNPSQQLVCLPIITEQELNQGYWNRLSLRTAISVLGEEDKAG